MPSKHKNIMEVIEITNNEELRKEKIDFYFENDI